MLLLISSIVAASEEVIKGCRNCKAMLWFCILVRFDCEANSKTVLSNPNAFNSVFLAKFQSTSYIAWCSFGALACWSCDESGRASGL